MAEPANEKGKGVAAARIASAKPTISSTLSPFMCKATRSAAICESAQFPAEHFRHHFARFGARQGLAVIGDAMEGVEDHPNRNCKG